MKDIGPNMLGKCGRVVWRERVWEEDRPAPRRVTLGIELRRSGSAGATRETCKLASLSGGWEQLEAPTPVPSAPSVSPASRHVVVSSPLKPLVFSSSRRPQGDSAGLGGGSFLTSSCSVFRLGRSGFHEDECFCCGRACSRYTQAKRSPASQWWSAGFQEQNLHLHPQEGSFPSSLPEPSLLLAAVLPHYRSQ